MYISDSYCTQYYSEFMFISHESGHCQKENWLCRPLTVTRVRTHAAVACDASRTAACWLYVSRRRPRCWTVRGRHHRRSLWAQGRATAQRRCRPDTQVPATVNMSQGVLMVLPVSLSFGLH
eukprot:COSAG02_NODE_2605_length_8442_cov_9.552080_5_plen_121_part_00